MREARPRRPGRAQRRAASWYRQALPLPPRRKAEVEKRLDDLDGQPPAFEVLARQTKVLPDESHGSALTTNLLLEVTKNSMSSPGAAYAGLELKGVRFLDVRASVSPKIERLSRNSFAGFMVDYRVSSGYGKRVAFGVGVFDRDRMDKAPHWGRNAVPDQYVDLGRSDLYRLDLRQFAPPGWDGNVWFTLGLQHAGLGTYVTAQLTPLAKEQERKPPGPPPKPRGALLPKGQEKPLDLPVKPTWRTTGEYPLIAGVWAVVQSEGRLVTIVQHEGDFVATTTYKAGEETVTWRAEGKISKSGHITMSLVHTHPHPPDKWLPQTRTAVLGLHGKSLEGYAAFKGGGHKFVWRLGEPREAEKKELPR